MHASSRIFIAIATQWNQLVNGTNWHTALDHKESTIGALDALDWCWRHRRVRPAELATANYLDQLEQLSQTDAALAAQRVSSVVRAVFIASVVVALLVGWFIAWYGDRAVRSECFPPPGSMIVEGRPVYSGAKARWRGWMQIILGIFMAGFACAAVYRSWSLLP